MAVGTYPGVYALEVPSGAPAISGVSTSTAVFIGMATKGPILEPRQVLGFEGYVDTYGDDTSIGEMTEQVRQFFLNGGELAWVVRVANGWSRATATLNNAAGNGVLDLAARDAGALGKQLRARVDYDTASPERTFNLTVFREAFDANGEPLPNPPTERHSDLGIDPNGPRFVETVLAADSTMVTGKVTGQVVIGNASPGFSVSSYIFAGAAAARAAFAAAIGNAPPNTPSKVGRFTVRVGSSPRVTVQISEDDIAGLANDAALAGMLQGAINALVPAGNSVTVTIANNEPLRVEADNDGQDVELGPAATDDISAKLGLGSAAGGVEVGAWAALRPMPSGLCSVLDNNPGDLLALLGFGEVAKANLDTVGVAGLAAFTVAVADSAYPSSAGDMNQGTRTPGARSLLNVQENLRALAQALTSGSDGNWTAAVHGHRLVLMPTFGSSATGPAASFTSANPDLTAGARIFGNAHPGAQAAAFAISTGGQDGQPPTLDDYAEAYAAIDRNVDIFNIMVLPRSTADAGANAVRPTAWGPASAFCKRKRAFLIVDYHDAPTWEAARDGITDLRTGVVKDHAAVYWPKLEIAIPGGRKAIDPSGSVAGIMSRIDGTRGVWKAPAGLEASVVGVVGVRTAVSDAENGVLNPLAVNVIRDFSGSITTWGARTMDGFDNSGNTDYRYVPVRRLALFMEESLVRGFRFAVFEPNAEPTWSQLRLAGGAFLNGLFRRGAFEGATARESYFVKVDPETTTPTDQRLGVVNVNVGFAPVKPAEFIIIRLKQMVGQSQG